MMTQFVRKLEKGFKVQWKPDLSGNLYLYVQEDDIFYKSPEWNLNLMLRKNCLTASF